MAEYHMVEMIVTKHYNCNSSNMFTSSITISLFINFNCPYKSLLFTPVNVCKQTNWIVMD
jgi:hypothetical protein